MNEPYRSSGRSPIRRLTGVQVLGTGSFLPDNVVRNEDLARLGYDAQWILQRTGIRERRHAPPDMATSDMGIAAARRCIEAAGIEPDEIDLLLVGTLFTRLSHADGGLHCPRQARAPLPGGRYLGRLFRIRLHPDLGDAVRRYWLQPPGSGDRCRLQFPGDGPGRSQDVSTFWRWGGGGLVGRGNPRAGNAPPTRSVPTDRGRSF